MSASRQRVVGGDPVVVWVLAGALAGGAIQLRLSRWDGLALAWVVGAVAVLAWTLTRRDPVGPPRGPRGVVAGVVLVQVVATVPLAREVFTGDPPWLVATAAVAGLVAVAAALDLLRPDPWLGTDGRGSAVLVGAVMALGLCWLAAQSTNIDVFHYQRVAAQRLLTGQSPWAPGYPNPYDGAGSAEFFGPGLVHGDRLGFGFPYPPLSLLLSTVGYLLGDVRIAHLLAVVAAGGLLLHMAPDRWSARAAGILLLTTPMLLPTVQRGFTEAFLILGTVALLWVLRRPVPGWTAVVALGLFLALKQYAVLVLPVVLVLGPRWATVGERWRTAARAVAVAVAVTLPLALWGFGDFLFSVVWLQFLQPFRDDAMSIPALVVRAWGWPGAPLALGGIVAAVAVATWWVCRRGPRTWSGVALGSAVVMLAFLLFNKQAFTNYYLYAVSLVWLAVALADDPDAQPDVDPRSSARAASRSSRVSQVAATSSSQALAARRPSGSSA